MKINDILHTLQSYLFQMLFALVAGLLMITSCQKDEPVVISGGAPVALSASDSAIVLTQKQAKGTFTFTWTAGTNQGTGASISYILQIDKKGNRFNNPVILEMGKAVYSKNYTVEELNDSLLGRWGGVPGIATTIQARVIAMVASDLVKPDTSRVIEISVTPYRPVTKELYIVGSASPNGWDIANAIALTPSADDPTIFKYQGILQVGSFKFPVNRNTDWAQDMYMKNTADTTKIYLHNGGDPDDNQWYISQSGLYKIEVSLLDLTIKITAMGGPAYNQLYLVGDATPNGWDIGNATPMVQNQDNLFQFTYDGILTPGDFKIPVNRNTDWGQDMFMRDPADSTKAYLHKGGDPDDNKWKIYKAGWYHMLLDLSDNSISYKPLQLYIVGSATSIGWDIANALPLVQSPDSPVVFTFTGDLVAGEFKFPVNRNTDWGQDMYMRVDDTHMYLHKGGASDDNKWTITNPGTYVITLNVQDLTIRIQKQ